MFGRASDVSSGRGPGAEPTRVAMTQQKEVLTCNKPPGYQRVKDRNSVSVRLFLPLMRWLPLASRWPRRRPWRS